MKDDDSRRGLEVGIDVRMERPQSEPTVWNPSAAILMVANSQDSGYRLPLAHWGTYNTSRHRYAIYGFLFFSSLSPSGGGRRTQTRDFHTPRPQLHWIFFANGFSRTVQARSPVMSTERRNDCGKGGPRAASLAISP